MVRDFDINLVRNTTIQELSDELWLTSSRYWLSYALIAITAWVNDYPEVARNALAECGRRDAIKTTLFFCLLNLRFDRMEPAKKWFYEYIKTLDPTMLQQESAVMLHAFLDGIFGKDLELEQGVLDVIDQWISIINEDAEISGQLIASYQTYLQNLNPNRSFPYEAIKQYCTNAEELVGSFTEVSKYDMVLQLLKELDVDAVEQNDENYKDRVDAVLVNLMSNYDEEERQLRNEAEYFNLIIRNEGFTEKADAQYQAAMALQKDSFNIGKQMINWAIYDETTNAGVRKFAFQNTKEWFKSALDRFSMQMEQAFPIEYRLAIDTWTGISNGYDQAELTENMRNPRSPWPSLRLIPWSLRLWLSSSWDTDATRPWRNIPNGSRQPCRPCGRPWRRSGTSVSIMKKTAGKRIPFFPRQNSFDLIMDFMETELCGQPAGNCLSGR